MSDLPGWEHLVDNAVPGASLRLYARWWQLETWLRELAYVELRAAMGTRWTEAVRAANGRQTQDAAFTHMAGIDNENPLAYLDYSQLTALLEQRWDLFGYALIEQSSWSARQPELNRIRHRIGHLRRPHDDDLRRLEQTLRDLERGAFEAVAAYNTRRVPDQVPNLPRSAEVEISVRVSNRPWATGLLRHVTLLSSRRAFDVQRIWLSAALKPVKPLIVHLLADDSEHIEFTFSGADDPAAVSDAIAVVIDEALMAMVPADRQPPDGTYPNAWQQWMSSLDHRILSGTAWNLVDRSMYPVSLFGA